MFTIGDFDLLATAIRMARDRMGTPRVHENGFIQLDLDSNYKWTPNLKGHSSEARLHVWPDGPLKHQATASPIHDHRFGFNSTVLKGVLHNICYEFVLSQGAFGSHQVHIVKDGKLWATGLYGRPRELYHQVVSAGGYYHTLPSELHESRAEGLTATIMVKTENWPHYPPRVICLAEQEPDNNFSREGDNPVELLWEYIDRALR